MSNQVTENNIPMRRLSPSLSRVHRRRVIISESFAESQEGTEVESPIQNTRSEVVNEVVNEVIREEQGVDGLLNLISVNWMDFWKRAKIYPDHSIAYPDASAYISSRRRTRHQFQRPRANAYLSDTDDESDCDSVVVV